HHRRNAPAWHARTFSAQQTTCAPRLLPATRRPCVAPLLLPRLLRLEVIALELLLKLLDSPGGVHEALLPGVIRMRAGPDFHVHLGDRRPDGHDDLAAEIHLGVVVEL